jgi:hypothetical protein
VVLVVLVAGSVLLGTVLGNALGTRHYDAQRHGQAADQYAVQQSWTRPVGGWWPGVEAWKAHFNTGTARYRDSNHSGAVDSLRRALELVPPAPNGSDGSDGPDDGDGGLDPVAPECRVRVNLSLSLEAMGDDAVAAGRADAAARYAEAQQVIDPCTASEENQADQERQRGKEDEATTEDPSPEPSDSPSEDPTEDPSDEPTAEPTPTPTPDPQQEELEERNREAERDRQEQQQRRGGGFGGGQNW